ncbi:NAD-dependent epimerase/dehydratase family protein [Candidatus Methylacidithermus pantelleriae]|uniref:ADP-L-glycero-D-manno-heptose-6-epimerase n=1 Tax=Candidatus Methylacidithermus pantelleriae TaxID=2744239 RepID=A0A8J2FPW0_9BACT|nr:NAD-dependent epimerase/dehydratase family protein [Candidatus Methylacidithermus pantelleriae]CAF0705285.1 ADP-L-glycero-D-manno-heptose-6-epimerase [Candidatus Methylacidithermus pantelleriae]
MSDIVLVTGGGGFIGSNLLLALQSLYPAEQLITIDNFQSSDFRNLEGYRGDLILADLHEDQWRRWIPAKKVKLVFHLASLTDTTVLDPKAHLLCNVEGWRRLLDHFAQVSTRIIYASSASVYGIRPGVQKVGDPLRPANAYAFSKVLMENLANSFCSQNPDRVLVGLRYFNVYGPREAHKRKSASMAWQLAQQIRNQKRVRIFVDGHQRRDFVYIHDAVQATVAAAHAPLSPGHWRFNVGSGRSHSFLELVTFLAHTLGERAEVEFFECPYPFYQTHTEADLFETRRFLGFEPAFSLEKGLADYHQSGWLV